MVLVDTGVSVSLISIFLFKNFLVFWLFLLIFSKAAQYQHLSCICPVIINQNNPKLYNLGFRKVLSSEAPLVAGTCMAGRAWCHQVRGLTSARSSDQSVRPNSLATDNLGLICICRDHNNTTHVLATFCTQLITSPGQWGTVILSKTKILELKYLEPDWKDV